MAILVRRSNLLVPLTDDSAVDDAWRHDADAITIDLEDNADAALRRRVKGDIAKAGKGAAEIFVRVNKKSLEVDLDAIIWPGLRGIMLPRVESAAEVAQTAEIVSTLERERGLTASSIKLIVLLESARAVWDMRAIITASARIEQAGLDEVDLAADLGIDPDPEYDPFIYARGRLAVEATAAGVNAIGMAYPVSIERGRSAGGGNSSTRNQRAQPGHEGRDLS